MKRKIITFACFMLLIFIFAKYPLAREDAEIERKTDKLVGALVTQESLELFDTEGYIENNFNNLGKNHIIEGDTKSYQNKLYSPINVNELKDMKNENINTKENFFFPDINGVSYLSLTFSSDEDNKTTAFYNDAGLSYLKPAIKDTEWKGIETILEGTIYIPTHKNKHRIFYLNPIYQDNEGRLYALGNTGISSSQWDIGTKISSNISETKTETKNGKTTEESIEISISIESVAVPNRIVLLEMDENNIMLSRKEYSSENLPEKFAAGKDTAYIITESYTDNNPASRKIYDKNAENIETYSERADEICIKNLLEINWEE